MKNNFLVWICMISVMAGISCKTPEATIASSNQPAAENTEDKSKSLSSERERVVNKEKWLGSEIIDEAVNRLDSKLSTSKATNEKLKLVLTDSFKSIGGQISGTYPLKDAREMGKKIIINSQGPILQILENDVQKSAFKELLLN